MIPILVNPELLFVDLLVFLWGGLVIGRMSLGFPLFPSFLLYAFLTDFCDDTNGWDEIIYDFMPLRHL
jgi:hypothetical protein